MSTCHKRENCNLEVSLGGKRIVLAGNPNTGKSVVFHYLTGIYVDVSNYPGTTLEISSGRAGKDVIIDTPGVYGISSFNDEERVARDVILGADLVINVVSAVHLERDLFLTQQIIDAGLPAIMALNMVDEAKKMGISIDISLLSGMMGIPVVETVAVKGIGLDSLKEKIAQARRGIMTPGLAEVLQELSGINCSPGENLLVLEGDQDIAAKLGVPPQGKREEIYKLRRIRVNEIGQRVKSEVLVGSSFRSLLGRLMIMPATGIPLLALTLYLMYKIIGVFVAGTVVGFAEETIMLGKYEPWIRHWVGQILPLDSPAGYMLVGEFGLLTMTFTYLIGLLMPLVGGFYLLLSILEDSGYLPRIATLVDRVLSSIGLNGRAVIPMILGFGCVTMATITTRLLATEREKKIAIFLLGLTIPCSAQLGVIAGLLAGVGGQYVILYALVIFSVLVMAGTALNSLLPGEPSHLLIDLPQLRLPQVKNVLRKTWIKTFGFLKEAAPLFALGAFLISMLQLTGILDLIQRWLSPLTVGWLGLPQESATAFVMGIVRRDFGAAGLTAMELSSVQIVIALVVITLFVPCIASILVIFKERTRPEAAWIWGASIVIAFITGGIVNQLYKYVSLLGGTFVPLMVCGGFLVLTALISCAFKLLGKRKRSVPAAVIK